MVILLIHYDGIVWTDDLNGVWQKHPLSQWHNYNYVTEWCQGIRCHSGITIIMLLNGAKASVVTVA